MNKKSVTDLQVRGKKVLVRVDFNVPLTAQGEAGDDTRIRAALPTIQYLREQLAKVILVSHLGRPKGRPEDKYRLDPVARRLTELIPGGVVRKTGTCIGPEVEEAIRKMQEGDVLLLENIRICPGVGLAGRRLRE